MKKKSNVLKRNSGFLVGCIVAAGVSGFAANTVMTKGLPMLTEEPESEQLESTAQTVQEETAEARAYETDPFTVTASGNIIKGVETEKETEKEDETELQTDENGDPVTETLELDENGNIISSSGGGSQGSSGSDSGEGGSGSYSSDGGEGGSGSYSGDGGEGGSGGYSGDGSSGSGGSSYDGPAIEIYDTGNGDYYYTDDTGNSGNGSSSATYTDFWSDSIFPETNSRYIDESELYNFSASEIRLIRNEIFARHGRIFTSPDLIEYFGRKAWYVPTYSPEEFDAHMNSYLNDYELANLNVILKYEDALAGY